MRICKLQVKGELTYAEVLGLTDTPTGVKARLRFADGTRDLVAVTSIHSCSSSSSSIIIRRSSRSSNICIRTIVSV